MWYFIPFFLPGPPIHQANRAISPHARDRRGHLSARGMRMETYFASNFWVTGGQGQLVRASVIACCFAAPKLKAAPAIWKEQGAQTKFELLSFYCYYYYRYTTIPTTTGQWPQFGARHILDLRANINWVCFYIHKRYCISLAGTCGVCLLLD